MATYKKKGKKKIYSKIKICIPRIESLRGFFDQHSKRGTWYNNRRNVSVSKRSSNQINAFIAHMFKPCQA